MDLTKSVSLSDDHVLLRQWSPADLDGLIEVGLHPKIWLHTVNCLVNVSTKDRRVEIGWTWLAVGSQGRGINTRAKYLLLEHCFESLSAHRVEFKTDAANRRARGALRKIGATPEGTLRSHTLMHDGRYRDTVYYSILEDEWPQVRKHLRSLIESG